MNKMNNLLWGILLLCTCLCIGCSNDGSDSSSTPPIVTGFFPKEGDAGTQVTISGEYLGSSFEGNVYFNGIELYRQRNCSCRSQWLCQWSNYH